MMPQLSTPVSTNLPFSRTHLFADDTFTSFDPLPVWTQEVCTQNGLFEIRIQPAILKRPDSADLYGLPGPLEAMIRQALASHAFLSGQKKDRVRVKASLRKLDRMISGNHSHDRLALGLRILNGATLTLRKTVFDRIEIRTYPYLEHLLIETGMRARVFTATLPLAF